MKRSKHSLSHYQLSTFDMGDLIPVGHFEVLPGDSVRMSTSALLRVSPLLTPVMHPVTVRLHHWFVPFRIMWDEWEDFITGGPDGLGSENPLPSYTTTSAVSVNQILTHLGVPVTTPVGTELVAWPIRAYNTIFNEFYRDQDLVAESPPELHSISVRQVAWEKDYFTAARPWTQKGPEVTLPLGGQATVKTSATQLQSGGQPAVTWKQNTGGDVTTGVSTGMFGTPGLLSATTTTATAQGGGVYPSNLYADLVGATAASVNDVRLAFALQRYQEARAQYGSRFTEYLRYLGVRSSDARLQRPEYLGGGRATISFSEVLRTGNSDATADAEAPVGELRGHGISALRSRRWIRFFEEHGIVMTLASIRPRSIYVDGLHRSWRRQTKEDYWQKELELIGQQEIKQSEVYAASATPDAVFGYGDRYSEYRHVPSIVTGEFQTIMQDWHLGRVFGSEPALNGSFVTCLPSKRIHAEQTTHSIWGMFSHSIQARRLLGKRTIGRIF